MSDFRVVKIASSSSANIIKDFDTQTAAESFAQKTSLKDANHSYEVQKPDKKIGKYQTVVTYKNGQEALRPSETLKKQED